LIYVLLFLVVTAVWGWTFVLVKDAVTQYPTLPFLQTWAQAHISANRTALILATEPAWALVAAVALAGQRFGLVEALGAALLLAAIVGHEGASLKFEPHVQPAPS
jgi:EamA-like transporter family